MRKNAPRPVANRASRPGHILLRILAVAGLAGLSGCLFYGHVPLQVGALPLWQFAGLLYAGMVGASAAFIFTLLPKLAQIVEFTAISRLGLALAATQHPEAAAKLLASPLLNATLVVGIAILLRTALRARPWLRVRVANRFAIARAAHR